MTRTSCVTFCLGCLIASGLTASLRGQGVLPESPSAGTSPATMVRDSLMQQVHSASTAWRERYEARTQPEQIRAYQLETRERFLAEIGGLPPRTELNAEVVARVHRDGFSVEKVMFESQPDFHVTGGLFLPDPDRFPPPWPAVLVVCGHSAEGKLYDGYQRGTALAALHGIAGLIIDPIGQGERNQVLGEGAKPAVPSSTTEHTLLGTAAMLVGWNTARWEIWDGMRAIDYLQSREDILADRIGCMGNSGGGTQTSYLMALDDRVQAAAPSCYITRFQRLLETIGPQDAEQNIHGQLGWGMDHADYLMMRAPRPTLIACATKDFFDITGTWSSYRDAKRLYTRMGAGDQVQLVEVDAAHGWHPLLRQASVRFMVQHLRQQLVDVSEPDLQVLSAEEFRVSPRGQVLTMPGEVSAFDHVRTENKKLAAQRQQLQRELSREAWQQRVREVAGIRPLAELPAPEVELQQASIVGETIHQPLVMQVEEDIWLPAVSLRSQSPGVPSSNTVTVFLHAEGKDSALADQRVAEWLRLGHTVLAIDIRGTGETEPTERAWYHERFGRNGGNATVAYLLGQSLVGLRTEDILRAVRWAADTPEAPQVHLVATGELTVPALHAAALEPERFASVELEEGLTSWTDVVDTPLTANQIPNVVHGALRLYDLPDLAALIGDSLTVRSPRNAANEPLQAAP